MGPEAGRPIVSVFIDGTGEARFLEPALRSVLAQSLGATEILLPRDASLPGSLAGHPGLRRFEPGQNIGQLARGEWIATLGADDLMHPQRLERLVAAGERDGASMVADDVLLFGGGSGEPPRAVLSNVGEGEPRWVGWDAAVDLEAVRPIIRTSLLRADDARRPAVTVQASDLPSAIPALLATGVTLRVLPDVTYFRRRPGDTAPGREGRKPSLCVLSRQRVVGLTNGSSTYLLSLCEAFDAAGYDVHLICPSPVVFGRWPYLALQPEMSVFRSISIRGGRRVGRYIVAEDPKLAIGAGLAVLARTAGRFGLDLGLKRWTEPAPYAIAQPLTREDAIFVATHARERADAILADYAFLTEVIPYALRPEARSAVVMHDLFSSRAAQVQPGRRRGLRGLARPGAGDAHARGGGRRARHPGRGGGCGTPRLARPSGDRGARWRCAPWPRRSPARDRTVLFVGSNTAPNTDGLRWFFDEVWPAIRAAEPGTELQIAGTVWVAFSSAPEGARFLGRVPDLDPFYREATVVVSPLRAGSGLKIKLVEALGQGKAVVATSTTLQGVEDMAGPAVIRADEAIDFANSVLRLLRDGALRARYAEAALDAARTYFSPEACYAEAVAFLGERGELRSSTGENAAPLGSAAE
jgi:glycosyltransferase involved in cell wall biosynthesis